MRYAQETIVSDDDNGNWSIAIDLHYWADSSDYPVVAVASILRGNQIHGVPYESRSEGGEVVEISLTTSKGKLNPSLFEKSLVENGEVPVYCSFDGSNVTKVILSLEEFRNLESMSKGKDFNGASALLHTKIAEQDGAE